MTRSTIVPNRQWGPRAMGTKTRRYRPSIESLEERALLSSVPDAIELRIAQQADGTPAIEYDPGKSILDEAGRRNYFRVDVRVDDIRGRESNNVERIKVNLYWATGPNESDIIDRQKYHETAHETAQIDHEGSKAGDVVSLYFDRFNGTQQTPPAGATYLIAVIDPDGYLVNQEKNRGDNVASVAIAPAPTTPASPKPAPPIASNPASDGIIDQSNAAEGVVNAVGSAVDTLNQGSQAVLDSLLAGATSGLDEAVANLDAGAANVFQAVDQAIDDIDAGSQAVLVALDDSTTAATNFLNDGAAGVLVALDNASTTATNFLNNGAANVLIALNNASTAATNFLNDGAADVLVALDNASTAATNFLNDGAEQVLESPEFQHAALAIVGGGLTTAAVASGVLATAFLPAGLNSVGFGGQVGLNLLIGSVAGSVTPIGFEGLGWSQDDAEDVVEKFSQLWSVLGGAGPAILQQGPFGWNYLRNTIPNVLGNLAVSFDLHGLLHPVPTFDTLGNFAGSSFANNLDDALINLFGGTADFAHSISQPRSPASPFGSIGSDPADADSAQAASLPTPIPSPPRGLTLDEIQHRVDSIVIHSHDFSPRPKVRAR